MHKLIFYFLLSICSISCGQKQTKVNGLKKTTESINMASNSQCDYALKFINDYVENCNKMKNAIGIIEWVNSNQLVTESFKTELTKVINEANEKDPELGLDFDPIFDAQDYPENGFELETIDRKSGYLVLKGKDFPQFKLAMKIKNENGKWLVDGCGIINIPKNKRIER
jgi:hypothetical protein